MKRSEIALIIAECLIEPHFDDVNKEASYILKKLEKAGMLPPICRVTIKDGKHTPTEHKWDDEEE